MFCICKCLGNILSFLESDESEESEEYLERRTSSRKRINYKESSDDESDPEFKWKTSSYVSHHSSVADFNYFLWFLRFDFSCSIKTYSKTKRRNSSSEGEQEWRSKKKRKANRISDLEDEESESTEESTGEEGQGEAEEKKSSFNTRAKKINFRKMVESCDEDENQAKKSKETKEGAEEDDDEESSELEGSSSDENSGPVKEKKMKKPVTNKRRVIESDEESDASGAMEPKKQDDADKEDAKEKDKSSDSKTETQTSVEAVEKEESKMPEDSSPSAAKVPKLETATSPDRRSDESVTTAKTEKTALETLSRFEPEFSDDPTPAQPVKVEDSSPSANSNSSPSQFTVLGERPPKSSNMQNYPEYSSPPQNRAQYSGQYCPQGFQNDGAQRPMLFSRQPGFNPNYGGPYPPGNPPIRPPFDSSNSSGYGYPDQPHQRYSPSGEQPSGPYQPGSPSQYQGSYAYNESGSRDQNNGRFHVDNILQRQSRSEGGEEDDLSGLTDIVSYITQE